MNVVMRIVVCAALAVTFLVEHPAQACDTGPFALEFPVGKTNLVRNVESELAAGKEMLRDANARASKPKKLEIAFYIIDRHGSIPHKAFWNARQENIRRHFAAIGVSTSRYVIVVRPASRRPEMSLGDQPQNTDVTINLIEGCG